VIRPSTPIAPGRLVVDGHDVEQLALARVPVAGSVATEGLAFAGVYFGDLDAMRTMRR